MARQEQVDCPAPAGSMNGSRRKAQLLRVALTASQRLQRLLDPTGM